MGLTFNPLLGLHIMPDLSSGCQFPPLPGLPNIGDPPLPEVGYPTFAYGQKGIYITVWVANTIKHTGRDGQSGVDGHTGD